MTIVYRETDPVSGRWTGIGTDLSAFQIDYNFYQLASSVATLQSDLAFTVGIGYITITGNQLTFHMTDHTLQGPFTIPQVVFTPVTWTPSTPMLVNDVFDENGTLYLVIFAHTSGLTFDPSANDGMGHNYYAALLVTPGSSLPTGGATGQVLQKSSATDFAVTWGYKLPTGGNTGQILAKNSNTNQDAGWENFPGIMLPPSPGGQAGQVIATVDGTDENLEWISVVYAPPPSPAGTAGQVLSTVDGTNENTAWVDPGSISITDTIQFVIDGGGSTITTGLHGYIEIPYACTITKATLLADQTGSIVVDVFKCSYSNFDASSTHPVTGDKITASAPPTISSAVKAQDATLTGWTTSVSAGDILAFNVNSVSTIQRVTIALDITR